MISVTVRSAMHIAKVFGSKRIDVELNKGDNIRTLLRHLSDKYGEAFDEHICEQNGEIAEGKFSVLLNGRSIFAYDGFNCVLSDGDDVLILPAVSGG